MIRIPQQQVVLYQHVTSLVIWFAVLASQDKVVAGAAFPVKEYVAPYRHITAADVDIVVLIAIFDDDIAAGVVGVGPAAAGEIIEEDIVLHDDVFHTIDVDVLITSSLVVENIAFDDDIVGAVIDLQDVVIVTIMQDIVTQDDVADTAIAATVDVHNERTCARPRMPDFKPFDGDALHAIGVAVGGDHPVIVFQNCPVG